MCKPPGKEAAMQFAMDCVRPLIVFKSFKVEKSAFNPGEEFYK